MTYLRSLSVSARWSLYTLQQHSGVKILRDVTKYSWRVSALGVNIGTILRHSTLNACKNHFLKMLTTALVAYLYRLAVLAADDCGVRHFGSSTVSPLQRLRWRATRLQAIIPQLRVCRRCPLNCHSFFFFLWIESKHFGGDSGVVQ